VIQTVPWGHCVFCLGVELGNQRWTYVHLLADQRAMRGVIGMSLDTYICWQSSESCKAFSDLSLGLMSTTAIVVLQGCSGLVVV
jgi:hypothetical protein